jgi:hypothetical protein
MVVNGIAHSGNSNEEEGVIGLELLESVNYHIWQEVDDG